MYTAAVITISDKGYRGERVDTSGPNLVQILKDRGFDVTYTSIIPDEREMIKDELVKCADELGIALTTVITHRRNLMEKLRMRSVAELMLYALHAGYVEHETL